MEPLCSHHGARAGPRRGARGASAGRSWHARLYPLSATHRTKGALVCRGLPDISVSRLLRRYHLGSTIKAAAEAKQAMRERVDHCDAAPPRITAVAVMRYLARLVTE